MGEIGLQGRSGWTGRNEDGTEVMMVAGAALGEFPLALEVRQVLRSSGFHHFHWCCRGHGLFVSVQKNNNNTPHTIMNCNIVQDSTSSM